MCWLPAEPIVSLCDFVVLCNSLLLYSDSFISLISVWLKVVREIFRLDAGNTEQTMFLIVVRKKKMHMKLVVSHATVQIKACLG